MAQVLKGTRGEGGKTRGKPGMWEMALLSNHKSRQPSTSLMDLTGGLDQLNLATETKSGYYLLCRIYSVGNVTVAHLMLGKLRLA